MSDEKMHMVEIIKIIPTNTGVSVMLGQMHHPKVLAFTIGEDEARAITRSINGQEVPRPMTHDLMKNILDLMGVSVVKVEITELKDSIYYAITYLEKESDDQTEVLQMDSRPSDAIVLALRYSAPIYIHHSLLETAGISLEDSGLIEDMKNLQLSDESLEAIGDTLSVKDIPKDHPIEPLDEYHLKMRELNFLLHEAIKKEDYEAAARIRDEIRKLEESK